ncbi:MAG: magnesium-translocating P-type ATPase [Negativicutes bacterium]|nr:magnesium-translocating P-type ATPase [Negativicutes bacterium]
MEAEKKIKYWSLSPDAVLQELQSSRAGLSREEAARRLKQNGANAIQAQKKNVPLRLFLNQFKSLIILIMLIATAISAATGDWLDSIIILVIVLASAVLSFLQEYSADHAISELRSRIQQKSTVLRNGQELEIPTIELVPGDIVLLSAGSLIPADGLILECEAFHVNQSILTGEAFAVEKEAVTVEAETAVANRKNCVFMGTNVRSGTATVLVAETGLHTEFGQIAKDLETIAPETEFGRGVRHFGYLLAGVMLVLTLFVFLLNLVFRRPFIDSLLFSVALAIGITPQLLPAIINITLSQGAQAMAKKGVIVRHLTALENFGSMDLLCTDKTGTLTEGVVRLDAAVDIRGNPSETVFRLAYLNSKLQIGLVNDLDKVIIADRRLEIDDVKKIGEIPFDFLRKRLSVIVQEAAGCKMITKGALNNILPICSKVETETGEQILSASLLAAMNQHLADWSDQGFRVLGIAQKSIEVRAKYSLQDEQDLVFTGFLLFLDPLKADVIQTVTELAQLGIQLRVITGDNHLVALHIAKSLGMQIRQVLTGSELTELSDDALRERVETTDLFTEVNPSQKERIILALKKQGHVVGYMGDGINDAPALHVADVSISVNTAVDVAKESADFVLQEKNLSILKNGVILGRATFANTLKYINITTSANFGNMFSMAGASLFLPFLPLLPKQILLINFISDFPAMTIAADTVDEETIAVPQRWDMRSIRNFMFTFGFISTAFDYLSFAVLLVGFQAGEELFQSSWFVLSILTELLILLVARTRKPFYQSKPAPLLLYSTIAVGIFTLILPYFPLQKALNIVAIPLPTLLSLLGIALLYIITTEIAKYFFYRKKTS